MVWTCADGLEQARSCSSCMLMHCRPTRSKNKLRARGLVLGSCRAHVWRGDHVTESNYASNVTQDALSGPSGGETGPVTPSEDVRQDRWGGPNPTPRSSYQSHNQQGLRVPPGLGSRCRHGNEDPRWEPL